VAADDSLQLHQTILKQTPMLPYSGIGVVLVIPFNNNVTRQGKIFVAFCFSFSITKYVIV